jgi:eukaryotic-like serine/threonine-protein kinase
MSRTQQHWEQVKDVLYEALMLAPEERSRFLDEACSSNDTLRAQVDSYLAAEEGIRTSFLPMSLAGWEPGENESAPVAGLQEGQLFAGRFQIVRKLGEGGMGQVWLAEQTSPVRRQVALKLIRAGMYDDEVAERFRSERQSLAIMDHPAIAKVFDAGTTPEGQPYFVMEYVPGLPITEYCNQKKLKIRERILLFIQACEGVQHAHQKAILHRDVKPANILVVEVDGAPMPRLIDFGLAKANTPLAPGGSISLHLGHLVGTPGYISPELADPSVQDIDTRVDVYSLGVVLYVLLTGFEPLDVRQWKNRPLDELLQKVRTEEPMRPSARIGADRNASVATAEARGTDPGELASLLRGDLDWITMKALEKDRERRYGTPSELVADLRRFLSYEPVLARPASAGYQFRKYIRRHRVGAAVTVALIFLLAVFSVLEAIQLRRVTRERDRASRERDRATRITDFMTGMFKVSDPSQARGNSVTAREILDKASKAMGAGLAKDPDVQSQMMQVMSETYFNLGLFGRAHDLAQRALGIRMKLLGPDNPQTLETLDQIGSVLEREGKPAEAEKLDRQTLASELRVLGPEDPLTLMTMGRLAVAMLSQGRYADAEKLDREELAIATRTMGPDNPTALAAMAQLGSAIWFQARYAEAEQQFRQVLEMDRRVLGVDHPETLTALLLLGRALDSEGHSADAEPVYRQYLAQSQHVLGPEHRNVAIAMQDLATLVIHEGRLEEGEKLSRQLLALRLKILGPEHRETLLAQLELVDVLVKEGNYPEAEKQQRETLATQFRVLGPEDSDTLVSQSNLAGILIAQGRYAEGEKIARETLEVETRKLGPLHPYTLLALQQLGTAMGNTHRYAAATKLFRDVIEKQSHSATQGNGWSAWYSFACVAAGTNHLNDAVQYLKNAVHQGYEDADGLIADEDLKNLRQDSRFKELVASLRRPAAKDHIP